MLIYIFLAVSAVLAVCHLVFSGSALWLGLIVFVLSYLALQLLFVLIIAVLSLFLKGDKKLEKQNKLSRILCWGVGDLLSGYTGVRAHITGREKLPQDSRFVFVCNHRSGFDPLVVLAKFWKYNISFICKPSIFEIPFVGPVAGAAGFLAIDRENDRNALKSILQAVDYLKRDICSIGIYPEGTRSKDGELLPFHAGSFKIAQKAHVPLAVACVNGTENITKNMFHRRTDVYLDILEVLPPEAAAAMNTAELAEHSRELIAQHLGTEREEVGA